MLRGSKDAIVFLLERKGEIAYKKRVVFINTLCNTKNDVFYIWNAFSVYMFFLLHMNILLLRVFENDAVTNGHYLFIQ